MKKHTPLKSKFNSAFSLVELLVVIAVIAVIAAIAIPNITGTRDAAIAAQDNYDAAVVANLQRQAVALGADEPTLEQLQTGVDIDVLDRDGNVLETVTLKLD